MSEVDELKPCPCGGKIRTLTLLGTVYFICRKCKAKLEFTDVGLHVDEQRARWNTRAESPDSVETCDYCNARLNAAGECDDDECDIFEYKPTPPVAAEGELEGEIKISGSLSLHVDKRGNAQFVVNRQEDVLWLTAREFDNLKAALQSRSTPPPVAGGELQKSLALLKEEIIGSMDNENAEAWAQDTLRQALAALQHQDCVVISRECAEFALAEVKEEEELQYTNASEYRYGSDSNKKYTARGHAAKQYRLELEQSLERKNGQSVCEHGNGLTEYCEPCGRIHGGG